jgi:hypothetical protein
MTLSFYYLDDIRKYAVKIAITKFSQNEKYLITPYTISANNGVVTVKDLNIKIDNQAIHLPTTNIYLPISFIFNDPIEISFVKFEDRFNNNVKLAGTANLKCWNSGEVAISLNNSDLLLENQKILNFNSSNQINKTNIINITNYLDPNNKGTIEFNIKNFSNLSIDNMKIPYGGGQISMEPFQVDLSNPIIQSLILTINYVKIVSLVKINDLTIDGNISGKIILDLMHMKILSANIETINKGTLSYKSTQIGSFLDNNNLGFLQKALSNFQYTTIKIESISTPGNKDNIKISLYGSNQDLEDGRPINLNLNLTLDLESIIKSFITFSR